MDIDLIEKKIRELQILLGQGGLPAHAALTGSAAHGAVSAPTPNQIMTRDAAGRSQVVAPSVAADIARKDTVDAVQTNLGTHAALTNPHSATAAPTADRLVLRDGAGRAQIVAPSVAADIVNKGTLDTHAALTGSSAHGAVSAPTASQLMTRDGAGRAQVVAPSVAADIATKGYADGLPVVPTSRQIIAGVGLSGGGDLTADRTLTVVGSSYVILNSGSPYSLVAYAYEFHLVTATTNPYIINLPQASTCIGYRAVIIAANAATTGLTKIVPYSGDAIGQLGANVAIYLQNVDQSGMVYRFQQIELVATASGYWNVISGQLCPDQTVDTDGQQYHLGKLHHLPQGNVTDRKLWNAIPPNLATWSAAVTAWGVVGVPNGAKAARARVRVPAYATAAGMCILALSFSDNNSNTPAYYTAHKLVECNAYAPATGYVVVVMEIDILLNASGQFYIYTLNTTNVTLATSAFTVAAVGYYMGC